MSSINRSRICTAVLASSASLLFLSTTIAFAPAPIHQPAHSSTLGPRSTTSTPSQLSMGLEDASSTILSMGLEDVADFPLQAAVLSTLTDSSSTLLSMGLEDVSEFYEDFPLQAAVLTMGIKASIADGIAQVRALQSGLETKWYQDLEFRRNFAYVIYGGLFIGALCHYEYDVIFPELFGTEHSLATSFKEVLFDNFITAPLAWLPPAYFIKALVYDYSLGEGLQKYVNDVTKNGLLFKYWRIWLPAQSISFTVVPDHLRVVFMASVSFFWFIQFSTVASDGDSSAAVADDDEVVEVEVKA